MKTIVKGVLLWSLISSVSPIFGQSVFKITGAKATVEHAIQLNWQSQSNLVYRIEFAEGLSNGTSFDTLVDYFPSQGTNTIFLDTGKYWTDPPLPHPKDDSMRFYRVAIVDTNTLLPPVVTITNLSPNADVSGDVEVDVHVGTADTIASVNFFVDGEALETVDADDNGDASYTINTTEWPNGPHTIFVVAQTSEGTATTGEFQTTEQNAAGTSPLLPVIFDNYISQWYFSLPGFDPSLDETQHITAQFISYSDWTLQIVDPFNNTVRNASGSGTSMAFDWDGNDDFGSPTSDGTFDFILTATQSTQPMAPAMMSGTSATGSPSQTELLAMPSDGSGSPVPFILYPPGADTNGLTIFEGSLDDYMPEATADSLSTLAAADSPTPLFGGNGQTTHNPHRPPPKPIKGTPGRLGVAWQGDHPDPGTNGIGGFNPPRNLSGSIQLSPNYVLPYGPILNAGPMAKKFEETMNKKKWKTAFNYGNDQITADLLRSTQKGGSNLFNFCNIGLYIGHGIRGANEDFLATPTTPSLQTYTPIYKKGVNAYDWVRMSEFDFGGPPFGLRWMGIYACNMLYPDNAQDMYDKFVLPMNLNLHILCAEETSIFMYSEFGRLWASYMTGGQPGGAQTIMQAWVLASQKTHKIVNPTGHTVTMSCAYWPDCVNDSLQLYTPNSSTDPSDITFLRTTVYP
jgi:hypothetical protein